MAHEVMAADLHTRHKILNQNCEAFLFGWSSSHLRPDFGDFGVGCDSTYHAKM